MKRRVDNRGLATQCTKFRFRDSIPVLFVYKKGGWGAFHYLAECWVEPRRWVRIGFSVAEQDAMVNMVLINGIST